MIDFGPVERMLRNLRAADDAEREGCRQWIEGVKRRLGLIGPDDHAAARMAQWEHDHLTAGDLPAALRAGARELDAELTLDMGQQVPELQACPPPAGSNSWQYWPPPATAYLPGGYLGGGHERQRG